MKQSLYDISNSLASIELGEEVDDDQLKELVAQEQLLADKGASCAAVLESWAGTTETINTAIRRLQRRKGVIYTSTKRLREYILMCMRMADVKVLKSDLATLSRSTNPPKKPAKKDAPCKDCGKTNVALYTVTGSSNTLCAPCADRQISHIVDEPITERLTIR